MYYEISVMGTYGESHHDRYNRTIENRDELVRQVKSLIGNPEIAYVSVVLRNDEGEFIDQRFFECAGYENFINNL